ncbi:hypothetical protein R1flu_001001 [Riccia fluitans]|uniref:Uncharacterized protein n=1 Tax=Riccia fluitans TaxID=41844 RepID=A0ABD1Y215_9MARC
MCACSLVTIKSFESYFLFSQDHELKAEYGRSSLKRTCSVRRYWKMESDSLEGKVHCSRSRSRTASKIIEEYLVPFVKQKGYNIEEYLDNHMDNRHSDLLDLSANNKHLCESLANSCFPPEEGGVALQLNEFFLRQFCDSHTCDGKPKHFPRGSGRHEHQRYKYQTSQTASDP